MKRVSFVKIVALAVYSACCSACDTAPFMEFDRMIVQHKALAYGASRWFADGRAMRQPPAGTLPTSAPIDDPQRVEGHVGEVYDDHIPLPLSRALFERGQNRFEIYCAACHGIAGDGRSEVARVMVQRQPPSLFEARVTKLSPGDLYRVVSEGYGLMPPYAHALEVDDRWAIVAYVRALQLSQAISLNALPPTLRAQAQAALK